MKKITRRSFFKWSTRSSIGLIFGYSCLIEPGRFELVKVQVPVPGLPEGLEKMKIGLIADFHMGRFVAETDIKTAVTLLQKQNPDIILLAGDFVEKDSKYMRSCVSCLSELKAPSGIYAVTGNHDYWTNADLIIKMLEENNIQVLRNSNVRISHNSTEFYLAGLDSAWEGTPDINKATESVPDHAPVILMVHEPDYADNILSCKKWIPLQVSGHSHGGQIRLPFVGAVYYPYLGKKYPSGLKQITGTKRWVYTTRGVGHTVPVRFNCRPEVSIITLRSAGVMRLSEV